MEKGAKMNHHTELVFILDKSGSMAGKESDTIGGFNALLKKQKAEEGLAYVTTVLFDNRFELLHDRLDVRFVQPISEKEYRVGASTALLDAVGYTIYKTEEKMRASLPVGENENVIVVIITDGYENASRRYNYAEIRRLIEQRKEMGWEFIFLGANIDAIGAAADIGIDASRASNFYADQAGINANFVSVSSAMSMMREQGKVSEDWKKELDEDEARRKKGK